MTTHPERHVEDILPEVWQVVEELKRLTEGLEESLRSAQASRKGATDGPNDA